MSRRPTDPIPLSFPDIGPSEIEAVVEVLKSGRLSLGERLHEFERAFARRLGVEDAVAVSSGTAGLHLSVRCGGIRRGDLVITSPLSFVASANAVLFEGAIPLFLDVDPRTGNLDPALVEEAVTELTRRRAPARAWLPPALRHLTAGAIPRPRGILPVHLFGVCSPMKRLREIARQWEWCLIEDACEALGSEHRGRPAGSWGDFGVFGFYPNKQITTGEGGMIVTQQRRDARLLRSLRNQGRYGKRGQHHYLGYNYRLDEMSAALGLVQLQRLDELLERRDQVAQWYEERLQGEDLVRLPETDSDTTRLSRFVFVVRIQAPADRDLVAERLQKDEIPTRVYFSPIHLQPLYRQQFGFRPGDIPIAEQWGDTALALPFFSRMTQEQVDRVCDRLKAALRDARA